MIKGDELAGKELADGFPQLIMLGASIAFLFYLMKSSTEMASAIVSGAIISRGVNIVTTTPNSVRTAMGYADRFIKSGRAKVRKSNASPYKK